MTNAQFEWPTSQNIDELLAFLPKLCNEDFRPVKRWHSGEQENGVIAMPHPEYASVAREFFQAASKECWMDRHYQPETAAAMLGDAQVVQNADLSQIRTMLTYCVRGERFCDGHWGKMIEDGHICRLLRRLSSIADA